MTKTQIRQGRIDLCLELVVIKNRAGQLGMFKTMHALDHATQAVGWERAELMENPAIEFRGLKPRRKSPTSRRNP